QPPTLPHHRPLRYQPAPGKLPHLPRCPRPLRYLEVHLSPGQRAAYHGPPAGWSLRPRLHPAQHRTRDLHPDSSLLVILINDFGVNNVFIIASGVITGGRTTGSIPGAVALRISVESFADLLARIHQRLVLGLDVFRGSILVFKRGLQRGEGLVDFGLDVVGELVV